jgi:hypothetical protein
MRRSKTERMGLILLPSSRWCLFLSRHFSQLCLQSSFRALRSSWRTWLCASKLACFSVLQAAVSDLAHISGESVVALPQDGGLHHRYERRAA